MTTATEPIIIPVYRGLSVAGNVLEKDEHGDMVHITVMDSTLPLHEHASDIVFVIA